jgi:CRP-like cAMP-binding protein
MKQAAQRLKRNPDLAMLSDEEAVALLSRASELHFKKGDTLLRAGDPGESMIVIDEGTVEVRQGDRLLARLEPGATIGEMALLDPAPRSATVVATSRVLAYEIQRDELWAMLAEGDPGAVKVLQGLTATVCGRLDGVNKLVQEAVIQPRGSVFSRLWKKVSGRGKK